MKKSIICIVASGLLLIGQPIHSKAGSIVPVSSVVGTKPENTINREADMALLNRLNDIKDMDYSKMKMKEKRELRKEVRSIQNQLQEHGGLYISVGAAIIIILLIILIF